jgi:hypothetical protein
MFQSPVLASWAGITAMHGSSFSQWTRRSYSLATFINLTNVYNFFNSSVYFCTIFEALIRLVVQAIKLIQLMKTKFGSIIVAGSGKIGGHVASRNKSGSYLRTKVTPVNPQSQYQTTIRNRLSTLAVAWGILTAAQRLAWNTSVSAWKKTNTFGDIVSPSGFNLFCKLNANLSLIGVAQINTPLVPTALPNFTTLTLTPASGAQTMGLAFVPTPVPAGVSVVVEATPAIAPGRSFVKNDFRFVQLIAAAAASPAALGTAYIARLGAIGAAGKYIWVRITVYSLTTGQKGIPVVIKAVIAA